MTAIRIRVLANSYTVTIPSWEKDNPLRARRYASAVHALHVVRTMVVDSKRAYGLEQTEETRGAYDRLCLRARAEIDAAIEDIAMGDATE